MPILEMEQETLDDRPPFRAQEEIVPPRSWSISGLLRLGVGSGRLLLQLALPLLVLVSFVMAYLSSVAPGDDDDARGLPPTSASVEDQGAPVGPGAVDTPSEASSDQPDSDPPDRSSGPISSSDAKQEEEDTEEDTEEAAGDDQASSPGSTATSSSSAVFDQEAPESTTPTPSTTRSDSSASTTSTTAQDRTATSARPAPPSQPDAEPVNWSLVANGTSSTGALPMAGPLQTGDLPNYDRDRDDHPGLLIQKGGRPGETDATKVQRWWLELPTDTQLLGRPDLQQWAAAKDFDEGKEVRLEVRLYDCAAVTTDCRLLSSGGAAIDQSRFGDDFGLVTISMSSVNHQVAAGRGVVIEITVPSSSDDDVWLAFGTTRYNTRFTVS